VGGFLKRGGKGEKKVGMVMREPERAGGRGGAGGVRSSRPDELRKKSAECHRLSNPKRKLSFRGAAAAEARRVKRGKKEGKQNRRGGNTRRKSPMTFLPADHTSH